MLQSMTGFGKVICELSDKTYSIEIKSLNSKQIDISTRIPSMYKHKEIELRNKISKQLLRGKIELTIASDTNGEEKSTLINSDLVKAYYKQIQDLASELGNNIADEYLLQIVMRFPEVFTTEQKKISETEWEHIIKSVREAVEMLVCFRKQEGSALEKAITGYVQNIESLLSQIDKFEKNRITTIKNRIQQALKDISIDKNRYEQELIYYLEKLDISEEKVRLKNHCTYFSETMKQQVTVGKKLNFIAQEIGREINTIGSKANDSDIQKIVVQMKDELEKIKEQLMNVV